MADTGREVTVDWRGQTIRAWVPAPLSEREIELEVPTVRATERAAAAIRAMAIRLPAGLEPLARLLLRAEGLASSRVEGVEAPLTDVLLAQAGVGSGAAAHIADNLAIVESALEHSRSSEPLTESRIHEWHHRLMEHGGLPERFVGHWRPEVGWIGGPTPARAVFVPAPPIEIPPLMDELIAVANQPLWDPVTSAAVIHAQFETIHPYGDGNGRVGRVLTIWLLARYIEDVSLPPPMSTLIARDTNSYIAALGAYRIGKSDQLIHWFSGVLETSGGVSLSWVSQMEDLLAAWEDRTAGLRSDSAGRRLVPILARFPVISAEMAASELAVSLPAARNGLKSLADIGILGDLGEIPSGRGRPRRWWAASELLDLVSAWTDRT